MRLPLLIGGATTSRQHTAVKIAPEYGQATVHVLDASRVVDVVSSLLSDERRAGVRSRRTASCRRSCASSTARGASGRCCSYEAALANRLKIDWAREPLPEPSFIGRRVLDDVPLETLVPYIDWTFFFAAWELKGRFPAILDHPQYGEAARELYDSAQRAARSHRRREKLLTARGVYGFWPAASEGDDIVVYRDREHHRRADAIQHAAAAGSDCRRQAESVARRLRRAARSGRARLHRRVRRDGGTRRRRARAALRARARRLQRDHGEGARRSAGRGVRRVSARSARARVGHRPRRATPEELHRRERIAASGRRSAIPRVPITARSSSCSICSAPRSRASSSPSTRR